MEVKPAWNLDWRYWMQFCRIVSRRMMAHRVLDQSAQLSFYFLLSLFPFLMFLIVILGMILRSTIELRTTLQHSLATVLPPSALGIIDTTLDEITHSSSGGKLSFALLFSFWAASRGMAALIQGLNIAYQVKEVRLWWRRNLVALALTAVSLVWIGVAVLITIYGAQVTELASQRFGYGSVVTAAWVVFKSLLLLFWAGSLFFMVYRYGPNLPHQSWRPLIPGTVAGVVIWLGVSFGFKIYVRDFGRYTFTYGSIGAVVVLMLWFYLSGAAILIGGEVNSVLEEKRQLSENSA